MDRELLSTYSAGLIATTGCAGGEVQTRLRLGQYDEARKAAAEFRDIFGKDNYFAEIMDHGIDIERRIMGDLLRLAKELGLPLRRHQRPALHARRTTPTAHAALLCVQSGSTLDDPNRFKFDADEFYLKSAARDAAAVPRSSRGLRQHAADRRALRGRVRARATSCRASRCRRARPRTPGSTRRSRRACSGASPAGSERRARCAQAEYEVDVIKQMGFPGYFLVVADFIDWAKAQGIRVGPGRGSAAGSMAAYAMGITELDPLEHGLIFERFLNPERVSMPDVDVDFDDRRRGEVIRYVTEKYGDDRVAQIVTYGTIKAKQALKDSSRVLGMPVLGGGEAHQGDAAGDHGQGHPARRHVRQGRRAVQGGRRLPRRDRDRRRGREGVRHRAAASRTSSASGACTRPA